MKSTSIVAVWVTSIALLLTLVAVTVPLAHAQMTLDITKAGGDKAFGGEKLGTVLIVPKEHLVWVTANMSAPPLKERYLRVGLLTMEVLGISSV